MLTERLQVLISPEQRRRLDREARQRETSVGSLVREALDASFGGVSRERKRKAFEEFKKHRIPGPAPSPEEIDRMVEEEIEARLPGRMGWRDDR